MRSFQRYILMILSGESFEPYATATGNPLSKTTCSNTSQKCYVSNRQKGLSNCTNQNSFPISVTGRFAICSRTPETNFQNNLLNTNGFLNLTLLIQKNSRKLFRWMNSWNIVCETHNHKTHTPNLLQKFVMDMSSLKRINANHIGNTQSKLTYIIHPFASMCN